MDLTTVNLKKNRIAPSAYVLQNNLNKILATFSKQTKVMTDRVDLVNIFGGFKENIDRLIKNIPQYSINSNGDFSDKVIEAIDAWYFIKPAVKFGLWLARGKKSRLCFPTSNNANSLGFVKISTLNHLAYVKFYKSIYSTLVLNNVLAEDVNSAFEAVFGISTKDIRQDFINKKPMNTEIKFSNKKSNISATPKIQKKMDVNIIPAPKIINMETLTPSFIATLKTQAEAGHLISADGSNNPTENVNPEITNQDVVSTLMFLKNTVETGISQSIKKIGNIDTELSQIKSEAALMSEKMSQLISEFQNLSRKVDNKQVLVTNKEESNDNSLRLTFFDKKLDSAYFTVEEFAIFCNFNDNLSLDTKIAVGKWATSYCRQNRIQVIRGYGNERFNIVNSYPFYVVKLGYEAEGYTFV